MSTASLIRYWGMAWQHTPKSHTSVVKERTWGRSHWGKKPAAPYRNCSGKRWEFSWLVVEMLVMVGRMCHPWWSRAPLMTLFLPVLPQITHLFHNYHKGEHLLPELMSAPLASSSWLLLSWSQMACLVGRKFTSEPGTRPGSKWCWSLVYKYWAKCSCTQVCKPNAVYMRLSCPSFILILSLSLPLSRSTHTSTELDDIRCSSPCFRGL